MVKPRENRIPIMMSDEELKIVDDWRFDNRVATRSEAVRRLIQIGVYAIETREKALKDRREYQVQLADFAENLLGYLQENKADEASIAEISVDLAQLLATFRKIWAEPHKFEAFSSVLQGDKWDYVALDKLVAKAKSTLNDDQLISVIDEKVEDILEQMKDEEDGEQ